MINNVKVYILALNMDKEVRTKIGESMRRSFYEFLKYRAIYTPIGWVIYKDDYANELQSYCDRLNSKAGKEVCKLIEAWIPKKEFEGWVRLNISKGLENINELKDNIRKTRTEKKINELKTLFSLN